MMRRMERLQVGLGQVDSGSWRREAAHEWQYVA